MTKAITTVFDRLEAQKQLGHRPDCNCARTIAGGIPQPKPRTLHSDASGYGLFAF